MFMRATAVGISLLAVSFPWSGTAVADEVPADIKAFESAYKNCEHFRGEQTGSGSLRRDAEVSAELERVCSASDNSLRNLRSKYQSDPTLRSYLAQFQCSDGSPCSADDGSSPLHRGQAGVPGSDQVYKDEGMGFEVSYPDDWRAGSIGNSRDFFTIGRSIGNRLAADSITFQLQRGLNPKHLTIRDWANDTVRKTKNPNSVELSDVECGGKRAILLKGQTEKAQYYSYYIAMNETDVFTIVFSRPKAEEQIPSEMLSILESVKFTR